MVHDHHQFIKRDKKRLGFRLNALSLATDLEGQARFEALRAETGAVSPTPGAPKGVKFKIAEDAGGDRDRMLVDTRSGRMEALIDRQETTFVWRVGRVLFVIAKEFHPILSERCTCWGGQSPWPIISPVAARHQCSGLCACPGFRPVQCSG